MRSERELSVEVHECIGPVGAIVKLKVDPY